MAKRTHFKQEVTRIFNDLDEFRNWVVMQVPMLPFNEADLYNNKSFVWVKFQKHKGIDLPTVRPYGKFAKKQNSPNTNKPHRHSNNHRSTKPTT